MASTSGVCAGATDDSRGQRTNAIAEHSGAAETRLKTHIRTELTVASRWPNSPYKQKGRVNTRPFFEG